MKKSVLRLSASTSIIALFALAQPGIVQADSPCPFHWETNLRLGSLGDDVLKLQQFLNADSSTAVASSGDGSKGMETTRFGNLTKKAVIAFQEKYKDEILTPNGLSQGTGLVGPATRAKLNTLCANQVSLSASTGALAPRLVLGVGEQPEHTIAPANALYVPFTVVTLTAENGDVTVNKITTQRVGLAQNGAFSYVSLLDETGAELSYGYLHSDNTVSFPDSFTIEKGASKTLTIAGNMNVDLTDFHGQMAAFQFKTIDASAPLQGTLPVRGTAQTVNSNLIIGSAYTYISLYDPQQSPRVRYLNDTKVAFSGIRIEAGAEEGLILYSITWDQAGTAGPNDIANIATIIDEKSYPAERDGHSYTSNFPEGINIPKGTRVDLYVEGDLLPSGVNRTVKFNIGSGADIYVVGEKYGFGIFPVPGGNTATLGTSVFLTDTGDTDGTSLEPFFSGSETSISPGVLQSVSR